MSVLSAYELLSMEQAATEGLIEAWIMAAGKIPGATHLQVLMARRRQELTAIRAEAREMVIGRPGRKEAA